MKSGGATEESVAPLSFVDWYLPAVCLSLIRIWPFNRLQNELRTVEMR
jgi:hypothetical protein